VRDRESDTANTEKAKPADYSCDWRSLLLDRGGGVRLQMISTLTLGLELYLPREFLNATLITSFMSVLALVGIFHYLNLYTKRWYFTIWTAAWLFYGVWLALQYRWPAWHESPILVMAQEWCVGASATFLLWGSACFLGLRTRQSLFAWFLGFLMVWSYVGVFPFDDPIQARIALFGFLGLASALAAAGFFRLRRRTDYIGAGLLAFGFAIWSLELLAFPFVQSSDTLICTGVLSAAVVQLFIAVSMIILTLEEVRTANQNALKKIESQQVEQQLLAAKVADTEERYHSLFDQASEAIFITDPEALRVFELNQTAERWLGLRKPEALACRLSSFCQWNTPAEPEPKTGPEWFTRMTGGTQVQLVRHDGSTILTEVAATPIHFEGRAAYQFSFREITERVRLEQQLRQAEKLSALGQMISGVAHELNNPLAVIKGYIELVLSRHQLGDTTRADLEKVEHECNRAAKLVSSFLSFAREQPVQRQHVNLNKLIQRVIELQQIDFRVAGVELSLVLDDSLPSTEADPFQLEQVLVNLVTNALQAMVDSSLTRRQLRISSRRCPAGVQVRVEDSGPGVPEDLVQHIFEPFFTTKETGTGTGLGLSIAHSIMSEHQGRITHEVSPLGGAAFVLELPVLEPIDGDVEAPAPGLPEPEATPPLPMASAEILVLDDEKPIAEMLGEMLSLLGHSVTLCHSGRQAIELIRHRDFDVILSDFRMPDVDGRKFYKLACELKPALARRIIFVTGDVVSDETKAFLQSTGNPHLAKPFQMNQLEQLTAQMLKTAPDTEAVGSSDLLDEFVAA
jgi:PAS domain S-box-containing protein